MQDSNLIALYLSRSETAITQTKQQYGTYCYTIAYRILARSEDAEECENDTYWKTWNAIPPSKPTHLKAFLGRITRNLALNRLAANHAEKRGGHTVAEALDELCEEIPSSEIPVEQQTESRELQRLLQAFLEDLPKRERVLFVRRYFYFYSIAEIAREYGLSESAVKTSLFRTRKKGKTYLERNGVIL